MSTAQRRERVSESTEEREGEHRRCAEERERDRGQRDARRSLRRSPLLPIEVRTPLVEGPHFPNLHHAPRHHTQARARLEQAEPAVPSAQLSELEELGAESRKSRMVFFGCAGRGGGEGRCVEGVSRHDKRRRGRPKKKENRRWNPFQTRAEPKGCQRTLMHRLGPARQPRSTEVNQGRSREIKGDRTLMHRLAPARQRAREPAVHRALEE